jgi:hypothetical protein
MAKQAIIKHFGKVVNGKRIYYRPELHIEALHDLEGQEFEEVIKLKFKKVTNDAHGFYRGGILGECMDYELFAGWERDDIHEHFARLFLSHKRMVKYIAGDETMFREETIVQSSGDLSTREMFQFCQKCIQWCAEKGIVIKDPEQYYLDKYKTKIVNI